MESASRPLEMADAAKNANQVKKEMAAFCQAHSQTEQGTREGS
jgi:hypothetical protein